MFVVWGQGNAQMHSFLFLFCFLIMFVVWGARECADAFLLVFVLFSYNVCCLGGKGMRRCIPFDFCSVFLCMLFGGQGNARCIPFDFCSVFLCLLFGGQGNVQMHSFCPFDFCSVF